jgi:DNA polymerase-3 subunit gamma/tau
MASQVLYRKWRPQTLSEVAGQEPVTRTLLNALTTGRLAHAYLFCGPRGTGKTSTGRILAKAVNCLSSNQGEPCNSCSMCQAITEGRAMDLIEIDGASNRGIDEIRDIREKIHYAPNIAKYKVYIIDEVHMLTEPAFNALLKTLEEPPPHAIFVLATTEVHKVPLTILSRCQRFDFRRIPHAVVVSKLQQICDDEGVSIDRQALSLIAKAATGSLRDAENLLEQTLLHYGSNVAVDQVREELGISEDARVHQLAKHVLSDEIAEGLATIGSLSADGLDLRQFNRSLVEYLRKLLLIKARASDAADLPPESVAELEELLPRKSLDQLSRAIKLFAQIDFRADTQSTLPLELALVDSALSGSGERAEPAKAPPRTGRPAPAKAMAGVAEPEPEPVRAETRNNSVEETPPAVAKNTPADSQETAQTPPHGMPAPPHSLEQIREHWNDFVNSCKGMGSSGNLDALLRRSCEVVGLEGDTLVLDFYHHWHKSKIEDPKYRHQVEVKLREVFGVPYRVRCTLTRGREASVREKPRNPVVDAALKLGARIIDEEREDD